MKRHVKTGLSVATNTGDILTAINNHAYFTDVDKPNQTHPEFITYDISCNEDFALHAKYHNWLYIFDFFKTHPIAMGSFATKYVNEKLLEYDPKGKIRIRFSLMPQIYADSLEQNTSPISDRLNAVQAFIKAGYEVHLNFSPVIVTEGWLHEYAKLFEEVNKFATEHGWNNDSVKSEVIFLTHNLEKHLSNLEDKLPGEELIWNPNIQEFKVSQYGGKNLRYKYNLKSEYINQFKSLHDQILPWNTVRYIF
jgi:spore photoproduct lyase